MIVKNKIEPGQPLAKHRRHLRVVGEPREPGHPKTRGECADVPRPCPYVACKFSLYADVTRYGALKVNFQGEPDEMPADASCALDVANRGSHRLTDLGEIFGICRERSRQLEEKALEHFFEGLKRAGLAGVTREWLVDALMRPEPNEDAEPGYSGAMESVSYTRVEAVVRLPRFDDRDVTDEQYALAIWRLYAEKTGGDATPKVSLELPVPKE